MTSPGTKSGPLGATWADLEARHTGRAIAAAAGISLHTLRYYVRRGLIQHAELHGVGSVYGPGALVRALAIRRLTTQNEGLDEIRQRFAKLSLEEIAVIAGLERPEPSPAASTSEAEPLAAGSSETWSRVALLPGLELHVRADATAFVKRVAGEIASAYQVESSVAG